MRKHDSSMKRSRKKKRDRSDNYWYFYDGSDPRTTLMSCMNPNCRSRNKSKKRSSCHGDAYVACPGGCETFHYCSTKCAKNDTDHHAITCQKLMTLRSDVKVLSQNADVMITLGDPLNYGNIIRRRHPAAFAFLVTRSSLANELVKVAREYHAGLLWKEATAIMQDNLRLSHFHLKEKSVKMWCYQFATCLLDAGRLDDVLSFTAYLINSVGSSSSKFDGSKDKVWIYPRYHDQSCLSNHFQRGDLYLVFVMFLAKLKQVSSLKLVCRMIHRFRDTDCFRIIDGSEGPLGIIIEYLIPCPYGKIMMTWESFEGYCEDLTIEINSMSKILMERNPYLLDEIKSLMSKTSKWDMVNENDLHLRHTPGSKELAHAFVENCKYSMASIPELEFWMI
mmetsp:Transcript_12425/g.23300  ORF Transcript_12425/g.23300 Transcript_12425/m.23300 type:complete len:392 (-) Transcript_12425:517-1692(-)